ncbi:MAG: YceH family protein [Candidatus Schekmanbacteria bacterium]|nr:YceH family protein [Candidatus Schekmanbacteria bacterium]
MEILLSPVEVRILGSLIEKELTTPQYYPLSLNALTNACNQKSNRDPVMELNDEELSIVLEELRFKKLIWQVSSAGDRVDKYKHNIQAINNFAIQEISILAELFLRGPQTLGELRTHTARFYEFESLDEVEKILQGLIDDPKGPFVQKLPREAGRKENRYAHLLCGEVIIESQPDQGEIQIKTPRLEALEREIAFLKEELVRLKEQFNLFKKQFE